MDVILLERIENLGQMGEVVAVKPGYARNYLLLQKKAMRATNENLAYFEAQRTHLEAANETRRSVAESQVDKVSGLSVVIIRQAGESGQLYGSVTARDIALSVTDAGVSLGRNQVQLDQPIKALGLYNVRIALHPEVSDSVMINVARSEEEAGRQARGESVSGEDAEDQVEDAGQPTAPVEPETDRGDQPSDEGTDEAPAERASAQDDTTG